MNRTIRQGAIFSLILIVILLINLTVIQGFREDEYAQNALNPRGTYDMREVQRGNISTGGQVLAESYQDENGRYQRQYPTAPQMYGPVVGYVTERYGAAGLESGFNGVLSGHDSMSRVLSILETENRGRNIELTIDPGMQEVAYNQLVNNGYEGAAVALRPSTGEVLAMATSPSYDPNPLVNAQTQESAWENLNSTPGQPLVNTATQETLPPGSIFKIITTAAGVQEGYGPDSQVTGAASVTLPGTTTDLTNYGGQACAGGGMVSLRTAFELSCNTAFVEMGIELGDEKMRETASAFGVGESYDLGLPMADGSLGELPDAAAIGQTAIGQRDVTMSVLQAAIMAATVANEGTRMEPYLVSRVTEADLNEVSSTRPDRVTQAISPEEAEIMTDLMRSSESNTFGYNGNGYASKTGTAEHGEGLAPHVWYVAFDPDNDVAVAVMAKYGGGQGQGATGGRVVAPVGRAILDAAPRGGE